MSNESRSTRFQVSPGTRSARPSTSRTQTDLSEPGCPSPPSETKEPVHAVREDKDSVHLTAIAPSGGVAFLLPAGSTAAETDAKPAGLRIGMIQTLFRGVDSNAMLAMSEPFSELLYSQTGIRGQFCIIPDGKEMAKKIHEGELQLGILHGIEFAWVKEQYPDLVAGPRLQPHDQTEGLRPGAGRQRRADAD